MKDITTEEAVNELKERIQTLKRHIKNYEESKCETNIYNQLKKEAKAIEKVLNELEKYKKLYISTLGRSLNDSIKQNNKHNDDLDALNEGWKIELEKKDKIIDAMAEMLVRVPEDGDDLQTLAIKHFLNAHLEEKKDEIKKYFEKEVKDE